MTKDEIRHQALAAVINKHRSGLGVTMGGGKTAIALHHMELEYQTGKRKFLVAVPKTSMVKSWTDEADKFGLTHLIPNIKFTTYLSLTKHSTDYDILYLDECHSLKNNHDFWLSSFGGRILGLTGTPPKYKSSEKGKMVNKFCPILFAYLTDEAVEDGLLNDYRICIHHLSLGTARNVLCKTQDGRSWYQSETSAYEYWHNRILNVEMNIKLIEAKIAEIQKQNAASLSLNIKSISCIQDLGKQKDTLTKSLQHLRIMRMKALMNAPTKVAYTRQLMLYAYDKIIVFANTQEQAEELCQYNYHSNNPNSKINLELFKKGEVSCMACVNQLSEGINIPNLREGVILHAYSNERRASQRIGRMLRLNPDDVSLTHVLCFDGTKDEEWVMEALQGFDPDKIYHYYPKKKWMVDYYGQDVNGIQLPDAMYSPSGINQTSNVKVA